MVTDDVPIRLRALHDAFEAVGDLYDRLEDEWELDQEDDLLNLIAGDRGAVAQLAVEAGGLDRTTREDRFRKP